MKITVVKSWSYKSYKKCKNTPPPQTGSLEMLEVGTSVRGHTTCIKLWNKAFYTENNYKSEICRSIHQVVYVHIDKIGASYVGIISYYLE